MPTVLRSHGIRFVIFVDDHPPPHVHAFGDGEAKIEFGRDGGKPRVIYNEQMRRSELRRAVDAVASNRAMLMQRWTEIHGRAV